MAGRHAGRDDQTVESLINQGEFHARRPRDDTQQKGGHQLGTQSSPYDTIPTSHVQTLPPGTAPRESTFYPHNDFNVRASEQHPLADPLDFPGGATSKDVHRGLGKPIQGQTSQEIHHDGQQGRKKQPEGLVKHGVGLENRGGVELGRADPRQTGSGMERQRGLEHDVAGGTRSNKGEKTAEDLPSERV